MTKLDIFVFFWYIRGIEWNYVLLWLLLKSWFDCQLVKSVELEEEVESNMKKRKTRSWKKYIYNPLSARFTHQLTTISDSDNKTVSTHLTHLKAALFTSAVISLWDCENENAASSFTWIGWFRLEFRIEIYTSFENDSFICWMIMMIELR